MNSILTQFLTLFFGVALISTTMLNVAFTIAPQTMTHLLLSLIAS